MNRLTLSQIWPFGSFLLLVGVLIQLQPESAWAKNETVARIDSAAEVFPESTIAFAEIRSPKQLINQLLSHPLRSRVESLPQVKQGLKSKEYIGFLAGLGIAQTFTGFEWDESLEILAGKGISIGLDAKTNSVGAVLKSGDAENLEKVCRGLLKLANQGPNADVNEGKYRNQAAFRIGNRLFVIPVKDRVFVSNNKEFAKSMVDAWLDRPEKSLASVEGFRKSLKTAGNPVAWVFVDLNRIRKSNLAKQVFEGQAENIGVEALVGGILQTLKSSNFATASFDFSNRNIQLKVATDFEQKNIPKHRTYFFGPEKEGNSFPQIHVPGLLASISAYRDIGQLWLSKEDLFDENHLSELSQADSTLSTLFSGLDFGEEVLGSTKPGFQFLARNQDFSKIRTPKPDIKLPEFAMVFRLKDTEKVPRRFKIAYQSFVGFLNIQLAMQGNPQLELDLDKAASGNVISATYLDDDGKKYEGIINYNFSPSIALVEDWFILSSTRQFALDLAKASPNAKPGPPSLNTSVRLYGEPLSEILKANSQQLIAQNMLEEGSSEEDARKNIDLMLDAVKLVRSTGLSLNQSADTLELELSIDISK